MRWSTRLRGELDQLPETLATMREASENIKQVSEDLTVVVASLRRVTEALDAAGLGEATQMLQTSASAMRASQQQIEQVNEAMLGGLAKLPGASEFLRGLRGRNG